MSRRIRLVPVAAALAALLMTSVAHGGGGGAFVGAIGAVTPASGPPGTEISYTVVGSPNAESECRGSSAFATEFLAADGTRLATGSDTVVVPETATPGPGFLRLICYIADETGRPVISDSCVAFEVTEPGTAPGATRTAPEGEVLSDPCPPTARVVLSTGVIDAQHDLGRAFNSVITPLGG